MPRTQVVVLAILVGAAIFDLFTSRGEVLPALFPHCFSISQSGANGGRLRWAPAGPPQGAATAPQVRPTEYSTNTLTINTGMVNLLPRLYHQEHPSL